MKKADLNSFTLLLFLNLLFARVQYMQNYDYRLFNPLKQSILYKKKTDFPAPS